MWTSLDKQDLVIKYSRFWIKFGGKTFYWPLLKIYHYLCPPSLDSWFKSSTSQFRTGHYEGTAGSTGPKKLALMMLRTLGNVKSARKQSSSREHQGPFKTAASFHCWIGSHRYGHWFYDLLRIILHVFLEASRECTSSLFGYRLWQTRLDEDPNPEVPSKLTGDTTGKKIVIQDIPLASVSQPWRI